jgi:para-nitrobenzyl esterase
METAAAHFTAEQRWGNLAALGLKTYPGADDAEASASNNRIFTDNLAWITRKFAEQQRAIGKRAFVYHFVHEPPYAQGARNLGSCHTCELPYVLNNLGTLRLYPDSSSPELALASQADVQLARMISDYWVNFARKGDPNGRGLPKWPQFRDAARGPVLHIGTATAVGDLLGPDRAKLYQALYDRQMGRAIDEK